MCGRYQFSIDSNETLAQIARETGRAEFAGEIFPSSVAPILRLKNNEIHPVLYDWGFPMQGRRLIINARSETADIKPMFRDSLRSRRCVIPSSGFYEWDSEKHKYFFQLPGEDTLYMAGIYDRHGGKDCFCILTTDANDSMKDIHDRMPLVLTKEQVFNWLCDETIALQLLRETPPALEKTSNEAQLQLW